MLLDYIKQQTQKGESQEKIKSSLKISGWQEQEIDEAFSLLKNPSVQNSYPLDQTPTTPSLPGAMAIFSKSLDIFRQRFSTFLAVTLIPMLIIAAVTAITSASGFLGFYFLSSRSLVVKIVLFVVLAIVLFLGILITQA